MSHIHIQTGLEEIENSRKDTPATEHSPATFEYSEHFKYTAAQRVLDRHRRYGVCSWIERRRGKFVVVGK